MLLNDVNDIFVNCHMFCNSRCWGTFSYGASDRLASLVTRGYIRKIRSIHGGILTRKFAASSLSSHLPKYFVVNSAKIVTNSAEIRVLIWNPWDSPRRYYYWTADHSANHLSSLSWLSELSQLIFYNIELVSTVIKSYSIFNIKSFGEHFSITRSSLNKVVLFSRPFNSRNSAKSSQLNLSQLIISQLKIVPQLKSSQPNLSQPKSI